MKIGRPQRSWNILLDEKPDLHLTVDTHYADTTNPTVQLEHHLTYREKEFAKVLHSPTYAIWDDHDYGPNNSDGTAKEESSPWPAGNRHGPIHHPAHPTPQVPFLNSPGEMLILWWMAATIDHPMKMQMMIKTHAG